MRDYLHKIERILVPLWPDAKPLLHSASCFELLCAVILSAQTTDDQVNKVTGSLFAAYPTPEAMALAKPEDVESLIGSLGFYRVKARHLIGTAQSLVRRFDSKVPSTMEGLLSLPGVGRKTANLVISACFGEPGIIVDTHVSRVVFRLGIHENRDPGEIEELIAHNMEAEGRTAFSHALNRHGKFTCSARTPACRSGRNCPLEFLCPKAGLKP
jgi:endonuclease-3